MQRLIERKPLVDALARALSAVNPRHATPLFQGVRLRFGATGGEVAGTNNDLYVAATFPAPPSEDLALVVDGRRLRDALAALRDDVVSLVVEGDTLIVSTETAVLRFQTTDAEGFPDMPPPESGKPCSRESKVAEAIRRLAPYAAKDKGRFALNAVAFVQRADGFKVESTDGRILAALKIEGEGSERPALVSPSFAASLQGTEGEPIEAYFGERMTHFVFDGWTVAAQNTEGGYPDVGAVLEDMRAKSNGVATFDRDEAIRAIGLARVMSNRERRAIQICFEGDSLSFRMAAAGVGESDVSIPVETETTDGMMQFDADYLLKILATLEGSEVQMRFNVDDIDCGASFQGSDANLAIVVAQQDPKKGGA